MYTEITPKLLVGGWVMPRLVIDMLANADVTHIVNLRHDHLGELVKKQFIVLECEDGETHDFMPASFWMKVFEFTKKAHRGPSNKIYYHVPLQCYPESPVGCYAGLRALGYSPIQSRKKLENAHPILTWHETAMKSVDTAFGVWCKQTGMNPEESRKAIGSQIERHVSRPFTFSQRVEQVM